MSRRKVHFRKSANHQGASMIEYIAFTLIVLAAMFIMNPAINRAIYARYKQAADGFGFSRQYDARRTTICRQDVKCYVGDPGCGTGLEPVGTPIMGGFYDEDCYQAKVMRPPLLLSNSTWDTTNGGCPACDAGNLSASVACLACVDEIRAQCSTSYCRDMS